MPSLEFGFRVLNSYNLSLCPETSGCRRVLYNARIFFRSTSLTVSKFTLGNRLVSSFQSDSFANTFLKRGIAFATSYYWLK